MYLDRGLQFTTNLSSEGKIFQSCHQRGHWVSAEPAVAADAWHDPVLECAEKIATCCDFEGSLARHEGEVKQAVLKFTARCRVIATVASV